MLQLTYGDFVALPFDAVAECARPGPADAAAARWVDELEVWADPHELRRYLRPYGAWSTRELADYVDNLHRAFWCLCCDARENGEQDLENAQYLVYMGQ